MRQIVEITVVLDEWEVKTSPHFTKDKCPQTSKIKHGIILAAKKGRKPIGSPPISALA